MRRKSSVQSVPGQMQDSDFIMFKLSYLTMLIMNMAFMNEDLLEYFNFDEDIKSRKFSFMAAVDKKYKDYTIDRFISHIHDKKKTFETNQMKAALTSNLKFSVFKQTLQQ